MGAEDHPALASPRSEGATSRVRVAVVWLAAFDDLPLYRYGWLGTNPTKGLVLVHKEGPSTP